MSRSYAKGKKPYMPQQPRPPLLESMNTRLLAFVTQLLRLPRIVRILIASLCGVAITFAIFPIVDWVYLEYFFTESTRILPSFVSVGIGIIIYMIGWRMLVGTVGEEPRVRLAVFWYLVVGFVAAVVVIALLLQGYSMVSDSTL